MDKSFWKRHGQIDENSYKEIFYALYPRLVSYSLKLVNDQYDAEEIVGHVMLRLWEDRSRFSSVNDIKSYLYAITRNASIDHLKKQKMLLPLEALDSEVEEIPDFDFDFLEEEVHALLIQSLNLLPEKCRQVFELSCLEGMKYHEVADELGISLNTVKSQRSRAIELLKKYLKEHPVLFALLALLSYS